MLVFGCGGVGLGADRRRGLSRSYCDRRRSRRRQAGDRAQGRRCAYHQHRHDDLHKKLAELTGGRGPDVVIEAIGLPQTFRAAVEEVAFTGRVVYIGYAKEQVAYETRLFVQKELDILGSRNAQPEDFRDVIRMLEAQTLSCR